MLFKPLPRESRRVEFRRSFDLENTGPSQIDISAKLVGVIDTPQSQPVACAVYSPCFTCGKDLKLSVRLCRALAERGIAVLRFDMSGLGDSGGCFGDTNFRTNVADLKSAASCMSAEIGQPHFLIGHSFGGAASLAAASDIESVRGVITLAAPSDTSHLADVLAKMNADIETVGEGEVRIGGFPFLIKRQMLEDFRTYDLPAKIAGLAKPVLAFHSLTDTTVGYKHALRVADASNANHSRSLITLQKADHLLTSDPADITFVADMISAWAQHYCE